MPPAAQLSSINQSGNSFQEEIPERIFLFFAFDLIETEDIAIYFPCFHQDACE
jgi:hypothetical protein